MKVDNFILDKNLGYGSGRISAEEMKKVFFSLFFCDSSFE